MRNLFAILAVILFATVVQAQTFPVGTPIGIQWTWSNSNTAVSPCPSTGVLANCVLGSKLVITLPDKTTVTIPAGSGTGQIGPSDTGYLWEPGGQIEWGTYTATLVAVGYDNNGNLLTSPADTGSAVNGVTQLNGPTGLTGTIVAQK